MEHNRRVLANSPRYWANKRINSDWEKLHSEAAQLFPAGYAKRYTLKKEMITKNTYNLEGKRFTAISNSSTGEVDDKTVFTYHQKGDLVWAEYEGGQIIKGNLIAKVIEDGKLDMRYHHINSSGKIMLGTCLSIPERQPNGKMKFKETWKWLSGDKSSGYSEIIEI